MNITRVGIDLAKNMFQLHGVDRFGNTVLKRKLNRKQMFVFFGTLPPTTIGLEACGTSHYWGRELAKLGHNVFVMPTQYVQPYVKSNKNDANDAEGICEAVSRPGMRFVAVKTEEQQILQMQHRIRSRLVRARTALVNEIRGFLGEFGVVVPQGIWQLRRALPILLEGNHSAVPVGFLPVLAEL